MTTFQIQCFLQVAQHLNFTEAASQLYVAQSSLSRNISNLEDELGLQLFIRTKKYVRLTPGGAVLYKEFSRIDTELSQAIKQARNIEIGHSGLIRIGVIETQRSENFLPIVLSALRQKHPLINVDIKSGNFKELRRDVLTGQIDIAITMHFDLSDFPQDKIVHQPFFQSHIVCALPINHPLATQTQLNLQDLAESTLIAISPDVSHGAYNSLLELYELSGFTPTDITSVNTIQDMLLHVESGLGYTILDSNSIASSSTAIATVPLFIQEEANPLSLIAVWARSNLNPIIPIFMNILMDSFASDE